MKVLLVARKSIIEMVRELQLLGLLLLMPIIFVGIAAAIYTAPLSPTYRVLVVNPDSRGEALVQELQAQRYPDDRPIFDVEPVADRAAAETALQEQKAAALLVISTDDADHGLPLQVTIRGDALYGPFYRAGTMLNNLVNEHADRLTGRSESVRVVARSVAAGSPQTDFDLYAPGMMIFALLMIVPQTAMLVAREIRWGTLRRLRLTRLRAWELLGGVSLGQMVVAVAQVLLVFVTALGLGFHNQGSLGLAVVVGLAVCFSAIGQGLLVACFVENDSQATNFGATVAMLQVFISGAFYEMPPTTLFTLAGYQIDLFDICPATHGFRALQQVLSYGSGLREIGFRLAATLVLSALYFLAGVVIFQRLQMRDRV
jgi:ABC-2 type transport system permease protein